MTTKSIRQLFVERLAKIGVQLINEQRNDYGEPLHLLLSDEQFAELDAALNDIEQAALSKIPTIAVPEDFERVDNAVDLASLFIGVGIVRLDRKVLTDLFELAANMGKAEQRRSGLNDTGELPELILPNVNAVVVTFDESRNMFVEVDGVNRFTAGEIDRLIIVDKSTGARYVVLRDGQPVEALPDTPEPEVPGNTNDGLDV